MVHLLLHKTPNSVSSEPGAAQIASTEEGDDHSFKTILLLSCIGLFVSVCLLAFGIDLSVGWI
jgi:hypothetical protein